MIDPSWIIVGTSLIALVFAAPTFFRELRDVKTAPNAAQKRHPRVVISVISILVILSWAAFGLDYYDRHTLPELSDNYANYTKVQGVDFSHETVLLDGKEFLNCHFDDVLFKWNATAPTRLIDVTVTGKETRFTSDNIVVANVQLLLAGLMRAMGQNVLVIPRPKTP
jgi:hypothetical protein